MWMFPKMGKTPKMDGVFHGKPYLNGMIWGYPYFRKHPCDLTESLSRLASQAEWEVGQQTKFHPEILHKEMVHFPAIFQLMVKCWFGSRWFGILRVHSGNNPFHKGIPGIQTTGPQTNN